MALFECSVCMSDYVAPVTAPCGHTLCRACYIGWVAAEAHSGHAPTCPACRSPLTHEPPAINIVVRDAQAAAKRVSPAPLLSVIAESDLVIDTTPAGLLGEGGFGVVRRATWRGTPVAVKSLQRDAADVGEGPARAFEKEMQVLARLRHPNVVPVFGVCHHADGRATLVEELGTGGTLHRRLHPREGGGGGGGGGGATPAPAPMGAGELARVGLGIARALAFAHAAGVTHNDIKSVNVLFNAGGAAVLADFGLAKRVRTALPNTFAGILRTSSGGAGGARGGGVLGTFPWTAPENFDDEHPLHGQPPGDVYSFGLLLYEMAAGVEPWEGRNVGQIVGAVTAGRRPALPAGVDGRVRALIERCWAQDPGARPTAEALVVELAGLALRASPPHSSPPPAATLVASHGGAAASPQPAPPPAAAAAAAAAAQGRNLNIAPQAPAAPPASAPASAPPAVPSIMKAIETRSVEAVRAAVRAHPQQLNVREGQFRPLSRAAYFNSRDMLEVLLDAGADATPEDVLSNAYSYSAHGCVLQLRRAGAGRWTRLHAAASLGDAAAFTAAAAASPAGACAALDDRGFSPRAIAAIFNTTGALSHALDAAACPPLSPAEARAVRDQVVIEAAKRGDAAACRGEYGGGVEYGRTALHWAAHERGRCLEALKALLANAQPALRDARETTGEHWSALHVAAYFNEAEVARTLLAHGASLTVCDRLGKTPLATAEFYRNEGAAALIRGAGAKSKK